MLTIYENRSMGPGESPVVRAKYRHMMPEDHSTWTAFIESKILDLREVWYDVHVGRPMSVPLGSPEYMVNVVSGISRKRIDVVARSGRKFYIIEVKPHANMESIGQVVTYKRLYEKEFKCEGPLEAIVVSKTCDADIVQVAESLGVRMIPLDGVTL